MIRTLALGDAPFLAALHQMCFGKSAWSKAQIESSLGQPTTIALGLEEAGRLFAFALFQLVGDEGEILTLATHPEHRRKGAAKQIIQSFLSEAACQICFLEVAEDNKEAIALYESLGFMLFSRRKGYYLHENIAVDALNYQIKLKG